MADLAHYKSKSVLMPSFICIDAVQPFIDLGIAIIYYPVTDDFSPDWQALETLVAKDTVAIMMVHYFGISQDIEHFRKLQLAHQRHCCALLRFIPALEKVFSKKACATSFPKTTCWGLVDGH